MISRRIPAYSRKSPKWQTAWESSSSIALSFLAIWRDKPTTARSAWNCAKDDSKERRALSRPNRAMRFIDMLYVGANEERKGYVRVDAKPAADAESTVGDH